LFEQTPAVAASLLIDGRIFSQTSLVGPGEPNLHPSVWDYVNPLPEDQCRRFTGRCAESALVSDQLWEMEGARSDGRTTTLQEAAPRFRGAALVSRMIREPGDPDHGKPATPCPACLALLRELRIQVIS
jgi:hypothetical protein